jgi:hypothetical protein
MMENSILEKVVGEMLNVILKKLKRMMNIKINGVKKIIFL